MSQFFIYLKLKPFLRQWVVHHFGNPVQFPPQSVENCVIRRFITKLPPGKTPQVGGEDMLPVRIPDSKQKPPMTYNYMNQSGLDCLAETIDDLFMIQFWRDMKDVHTLGCSLRKAIHAFLANNGMSVDYDDTLKMRFQRMRTSYEKHGVDLRLLKRRKNDDNY